MRKTYFFAEARQIPAELPRKRNKYRKRKKYQVEAEKIPEAGKIPFRSGKKTATPKWNPLESQVGLVRGSVGPVALSKEFTVESPCVRNMSNLHPFNDNTRSKNGELQVLSKDLAEISQKEVSHRKLARRSRGIKIGRSYLETPHIENFS